VDKPIAVVTGASAGIGRHIALDLSSDHTVVAVARREDLLLALESEAKEQGGEIIPVVADLANRHDQNRLFRHLQSLQPQPTVLVNNAGGSVPDPTDDDWASALELQFHAVRRLSDALVDGMVDAGFGRVVNIGAPLEPPPRMNASTVAKGALTIWSKIRSTELGPYGITVNVVAPGRILSEQILTRLHPTEEERQAFAQANIPVGYIGDPADVTALVRFLISPEARYITGEVIHVDGGLRKSAT
jgi:3-oxoacyl-[acyl-carrier protein] reductase